MQPLIGFQCPGLSLLRSLCLLLEELDQDDVSVEMTLAYESGEWASTVSDAWQISAHRKLEHREGMHAPDRRFLGLEMARDVVTWVNEWAAAIELDWRTQRQSRVPA